MKRSARRLSTMGDTTCLFSPPHPSWHIGIPSGSSRILTIRQQPPPPPLRTKTVKCERAKLSKCRPRESPPPLRAMRCDAISMDETLEAHFFLVVNGHSAASKLPIDEWWWDVRFCLVSRTYRKEALPCHAGGLRH